MKLNRTFVVLMTVMCVFAMVNVAFAANRVEVKVTSEPMPEPAIGQTDHCHKGGGFSLEFDTNTELLVGDQIIIDLPRTTGGAETVVLCRAIDLVISEGPVSGVGAGANAGGWTELTLETDPVVNTLADYAPLYYFDDGDDDDLVIAGTVYFTVQGALNSQRILVTVAGTAGSTMTVGDDQEDRLVLQFLDQKTNAATTQPLFPGYEVDGVWVDTPGDADTDYDDPAAVIENTLCLNAGTWRSESVVDVSIDTAVGDKFTYIPSNPQIAHYVSPTPGVSYTERTCKDVEPGTIDRGEAQGTPCVFDYETAEGYCRDNNGNLTDHLGEHRWMLESSTPWDAAYQYTITLEILVNGLEPTADYGVYWTEWDIRGHSGATIDAICADADDMGDHTQAHGPTDGRAVVNTVTSADTCLETNRSRTIRAVIPANTATFITAATHNIMWIDFPKIAYNAATVNNGDVVSVRVTIGASNPGSNVCGTDQFTLGPYTRQVGRFGSCGQNWSLVYPFFDAVTSSWYSGLTFVNMGDVAGTATINYYESDGDMGTLAATLQPQEVWVMLTSELLDDANFMPAAGNTGNMGDARAYAVVCADFDIDGFALLGQLDTTIGFGMAQGYAARQPAILPAVCDVD